MLFLTMMLLSHYLVTFMITGNCSMVSKLNCWRYMFWSVERKKAYLEYWPNSFQKIKSIFSFYLKYRKVGERGDGEIVTYLAPIELLTKWLQHPRLCQTKTRSLILSLSLLHGCQGPKNLNNHLLCLKVQVFRKLNHSRLVGT